MLCIPASAADAAVVNPNGSKTFLVNGLADFFKNGKAILVNYVRKFKNPPDCVVLDNFDNLISVYKYLTKVLRRFATCLLVDSNL